MVGNKSKTKKSLVAEAARTAVPSNIVDFPVDDFKSIVQYCTVPEFVAGCGLPIAPATQKEEVLPRTRMSIKERKAS